MTIRFAPKSKQINELRRISDCGHYVIAVSPSRWASERGPYGGKTGYWSGILYSVTRIDNADQHISTGEDVGSFDRYAEAVAAAQAHAVSSARPLNKIERADLDSMIADLLTGNPWDVAPVSAEAPTPHPLGADDDDFYGDECDDLPGVGYSERCA